MKMLFFLLTSFLFLSVFFFLMRVPYLSDFRFFLVQSGSMEPSIMTGDLILVKRQADYFLNEVITFQTSNQRLITHRLAEIQNKIIITKGDANRVEDNDQITKEQILGKVILVIPKIGFLVGFSQTLPGLILLVYLPAIILIVKIIIKPHE